ncbi:MAG: ROK family protein, partial [Bryobacteraceae bacterium]
MSSLIQIAPKFRPPLDPGFVAASLWNRAYQSKVKESGRGERLAIALERTDGSVSVFRTTVLPHEGDFVALNELYVERLV